jgi:hypothetical protein
MIGAKRGERVSAPCASSIRVDLLMHAWYRTDGVVDGKHSAPITGRQFSAVA